MKTAFAFFITLISVAYGLSKNRLEDQITNYVDRFLILRNTQKYCQAEDLLSANDQDSILPLSKVLDICEDLKACGFISFSPKRQLRNSIHYHNDDVLESTGANWICSGDTWTDARIRKYWISAVKKQNIQEKMSSYAIRLNTTGDCDPKHVVKKMDQFITPREAAEQCNKMEGCHHIIFNFNRRYGDERAHDVVIFCYEAPINRSAQLGYFIADKNDKSDVAHEAKRRKAKNMKLFPGAVITPDAYYKSFEKGEAVEPETV